MTWRGTGFSAIDSQGRTIWIADANRDDGKCVVVRVDETESHSNHYASQMPEKRRNQGNLRQNRTG